MNYPTHLLSGDRHITNKKDMANEFNMFFFTNVRANLAKDISNLGERISVCDYLGANIEQCLFLKSVDEEEVIITVKACKKINLQTLKTYVWILSQRSHMSSVNLLCTYVILHIELV